MEWSIVYVRFFNLINSKGGHSSANRIFLASPQRKNLSVNLAILIWSQYKEWKEADCSSFEVLLLYVFVLSVNNIFLRVFHLGSACPSIQGEQPQLQCHRGSWPCHISLPAAAGGYSRNSWKNTTSSSCPDTKGDQAFIWSYSSSKEPAQWEWTSTDETHSIDSRGRVSVSDKTKYILISEFC